MSDSDNADCASQSHPPEGGQAHFAAKTPQNEPVPYGADRTTTVAELRELIAKFVAERDWEQFHSPKNLAMSLAIEAAELMEHFQWIDVPQSRALADDAERMHGIGEELADVVSYALAMANALGIDVSDAVGRKMVRNAEKYPADEYRGKYGPKHG